MSRRRAIKKKQQLPDSRFGHLVISKFINSIMLDGKKSVAEKIVYDALGFVTEKLGVGAVEAFEKALSNVRPLIEVRSRRVGGATFQVPVEVYPARAQALALRWIISNARNRKTERGGALNMSSSMSFKLGSELLDAYNGKGGAVDECNRVRKMAESNRAFSHFSKW